jgi:hypothetical protein
VVRYVFEEIHRLRLVFPQGRGGLMEIRLGSKRGEVVEGVDQVRAGIHERLQQQPEEWLRKLRENPGDFAELEQTVHRAFQQMADQMMAGLLAQTTQAAEFTQAAKKK